jgi:monoamine oxidase
MLANFGGLTRTQDAGKTSYSYRNQFGRAGYDVPPGLANEPGRPLSPLALDEILRSNVWNDFIFRDAEYYWQASLLEPVGGMDNFFKAFARAPLMRQGGSIEGLVRFGAKVTAIEVNTDAVTVAYDDRGSTRTLAADYCVCTIPAPIFTTLKSNLPPAYVEAARKLPVQAAGKVGWQAERFWETRDHIYGGISWTTDAITQVWYPSSGFLGPKGTLTGAYMFGALADEFNARPLAERLLIAKAQGEKLHPDYAKYVEHGIAIGWNNMEFARFAWADETDPRFQANADVLRQPQGRFHMAGDQITFWSGWQEGALISAWDAVRSIDRQVNPTANRG